MANPIPPGPATPSSQHRLAGLSLLFTGCLFNQSDTHRAAKPPTTSPSRSCTKQANRIVMAFLLPPSAHPPAVLLRPFTLTLLEQVSSGNPEPSPAMLFLSPKESTAAPGGTASASWSLRSHRFQSHPDTAEVNFWMLSRSCCAWNFLFFS